MPLGYAIPVLVVALGTLLTLLPAHLFRPLGGLRFRLGVVLGGLPLTYLYLLIATTVLTITQGDVTSPAGWAVIGVAVLTMAGLAALFVRDLRTPRPRGARHWPWVRILVAPFYRRRAQVRRVANIAYGPGGWRQKLDVYHRRDLPADAPMLIHFHGGHYSGGHKNSQSLPLIHRLAAEGWVCISANYRLTPRFGFRDHVSDAKRVIAWAHEHGAGYGGDASRLIVSGSSAGGHLTTICAFTQNEARFQPGFEDADTSFAAALCLGAYLGETETEAGIPTSPDDYMRPEAPPFLIVHGTHDTLVPVENIRAFADRLRGVSSSPVDYLELPGAQHGFDLFHTPRFEATIDAVEAFARRTAVSRA